MSNWGWWTGSTLFAAALATGIACWPISSTVPHVTNAGTDVFHPLAPAYVGDAACAECHSDQAELHRQSGHSRTLHANGLCDSLADLLGQDFRDPYRGGVFRYECQDGSVVAAYTDTDAKTSRLPVQFAVGSGMHAQSFLTLLESDSGEPRALEHRVSLFADEPAVRLTPSHKDDPIHQPIECLGRIKRGDEVRRCIECHSTTSHVRGMQVDDLRPNVNCERCHGPGRNHLQALDSGSIDLAILNGPGRVSASEEVRLCGQCHRVPDSIKRLPDPEDPLLARFQPIGIMESACFQKSGGGLRCSTCHNPHATLDGDTSYGNRQCVKCHSPAADGPHIACKVVTQGDCVSCHMPKVTVPPGIEFRDHWIRPRKPPGPPPPSN